MKYSELKQAAREDRVSVHLHGFQTLPDGSQEYSDNPAQIDGWCTYIRIKTPNDPQQPFDTSHEADHATFEEARERARAQAYGLLGDALEFNHD